MSKKNFLQGFYLIVITSKSKVGMLLDEKDVWKAGHFEIIPYAKNEHHLNANQVICYFLLPLPFEGPIDLK